MIGVHVKSPRAGLDAATVLLRERKTFAYVGSYSNLDDRVAKLRRWPNLDR